MEQGQSSGINRSTVSPMEQDQSSEINRSTARSSDPKTDDRYKTDLIVVKRLSFTGFNNRWFAIKPSTVLEKFPDTLINYKAVVPSLTPVQSANSNWRRIKLHQVNYLDVLPVLELLEKCPYLTDLNIDVLELKAGTRVNLTLPSLETLSIDDIVACDPANPNGPREQLKRPVIEILGTSLTTVHLGKCFDGSYQIESTN